jgi:hypothetical protein
MTQRDPATGLPTDKPIDERGFYDKFEVKRTDGTDQEGGKHAGCRYLVLDLTHDEDARAAAKMYASRVVHSRPRLSADLRALPGVDDLRPGERYVSGEEVDLDAVRRRG